MNKYLYFFGIFVLLLTYSCEEKNGNSKSYNYYIGSDADNELMDSSDINMKPYCNIYVNEKFIKLLLNDKNDKNVIDIYNNAIAHTETQSLILGLFIGGGKRGAIAVPESLRISSGQASELETFKPDFYFHSVDNYTNTLFFNNPVLPVILKNHFIKDDTLKLNFQQYMDTVYSDINIYKLNDSILINNEYKKIWKLKGLYDHNEFYKENKEDFEERFVEMNYLRERVNVPFYNINHNYFLQLLEYTIEDILGNNHNYLADPDNLNYNKN